MKTKILFVLTILPLLVFGQPLPGNITINNVTYSFNESLHGGGRYAIAIGVNLSEKAEVSISSKITCEGREYSVLYFSPEILNCSNLESIAIPYSVRMYENNTSEFNNSGLKAIKVIIGDGFCQNGLLGQIKSFANFPVTLIDKEGNEIKDYVVPDSYGMISEYAFCNCTGLTSVMINKKEIQDYAFWGCTGLKDIYITNKKDTNNYSNVFPYNLIENDYNSLPMYCPMIHNNAFNGVEIKNIILHVMDYSVEAYKNAEPWSSFKQIVCDEIATDFNLIYVIEGNVEEYKIMKYKYQENVVPEAEPDKEEGYTFSGWSSVPEKMPGYDIVIKGSFIKNEFTENHIKYWALDEKTVVLGNENASGDMSIEESVTFNEKVLPVTEIMAEAFKGNTNITSVTIPDSVTTIGDNAFNGCAKLEKINLASTITTIGERAFANIDKLTDVTIRAEEIPATDRTAFENSYIEDYVTLHVPGIAVKKYKETAPWKNFKEIVAIDGTEAGSAKYNLIYRVDGVTYQKYELEEGAEITALEEPTKEGYTFSGWSEIPQTMPKEDVTVIGTFLLNKYLLIYMVDKEAYKIYDVDYGSEITAEKEPEKEGYTFSGWSDIPETMPAKNVIISGTFTQNEPKKEDTENTDVDEIKIGNIGKTTYCSEYDLDFTNVAGIKAYTATGYDNKSKTIWLTRVMTVPAGTGILVKGDAGTYKVPRSTEDAYYTNMFKGNTGDPIKIEETEGDMTNYYLSGKDGSFVSVNGSANIGKNKAYLQLPTKFFAGTRSIGVTYDDEGTTGIRTIEQGIVNGEHDVWFNLQGQRVDKPIKGLYIKNGKKVVVR